MPTSGSERLIPVLGNAHCGGRGGRSSWRLRPGLVGLRGHGPDSRAGAAPRVLQAGAPGTPWAAPRPARPSRAAAGPLRALQTHRGAQCQEGGTPTPQPVGDLRDPRPCGPAGVAAPLEPRFSPSVKWASGLGSSEREGPAADRALTDSCPGWESRCRLCLQPAKAAAPLKQRNSSPPHSPRAPRALPGPSLLNCTPSLASPVDGAPGRPSPEPQPGPTQLRTKLWRGRGREQPGALWRGPGGGKGPRQLSRPMQRPWGRMRGAEARQPAHREERDGPGLGGASPPPGSPAGDPCTPVQGPGFAPLHACAREHWRWPQLRAPAHTREPWMELLASAWPGPCLPPNTKKLKILKSQTKRACSTPLTTVHGHTHTRAPSAGRGAQGLGRGRPWGDRRSWICQPQ